MHRRLKITKKLDKLANLLSALGHPQVNPVVGTNNTSVPDNNTQNVQPHNPNVAMNLQQDEKMVAPEIVGNHPTAGPAQEHKKKLQQEDMPFQKCMPDIYKEQKHEKNVFGKLASGVSYFDLLAKKAKYGKNYHSRKSAVRA